MGAVREFESAGSSSGSEVPAQAVDAYALGLTRSAGLGARVVVVPASGVCVRCHGGAESQEPRAGTLVSPGATLSVLVYARQGHASWDGPHDAAHLLLR